MARLLFFLPGIAILVAWAAWSGSGSEEVPEDSPPRPTPVRHADAPDPVPSTNSPDAAFTDTTGFRRMGKPKPGEWLDRHDEPGQTFRQYVAERPIRATSDCNVLSFAPAGTFRPEEATVAGASFRFAGIWFGLAMRVLDPIELPGGENHRRKRFRYLPEPVDQYRTHWFLDRALPRLLSEDSVMLAAVTAADLYPSDDWEYVFGMAHLRRRVGVYSIARYFPRFWGKKAEPGDHEQALRRACKLVTHELGHCFGLRHCIEWECGMNGSNSLEESDGRPIHLCPVCLKKLRWNLGFDVIERYRRLHGFYDAHGLTAEAEWVERRIDRIEAAR
ncbi:MAG: archaemetzincin [Planctomycetota bacterium]